jgi:putative flippase GtrA
MPVRSIIVQVTALRGQLLRYAISGVAVAVTYVAGTLLLSGPVGMPIVAAIPIAYVVAIALHFTLQRTFVFDHEFAEPIGRQVRSYVVIGGAQIAISTASTAWLPDLLGLPERVVYVGTVAVTSAATFLFLRSRVFHPAEPAARA